MKNLILLGIILLAMYRDSQLPEEDWRKKVAPELLVEAAGQGRPVEMIAVLGDQADLSKAPQLRSKEDKGRFVYDRLRETARRTQGPLRALLGELGVPYRGFYLVNAIWVQGDLGVIEQLARRPEVARIDGNPPLTFSHPLPAEEEGVRQREGVEWGLLRIGADRVWEMGIRGEGAVVGGGDTGYDWQHPALSRQYRGRQADGSIDHNYNWHDAIHKISPLHGEPDSLINPKLNPCGLDSPFPCDDNGHGTHTMGTMVGDDLLGNQIGVAPAARWIACRNMERGYGSPATYIECFEWFLAPTDLQGENPNPDLAPHVINNSWGCPLMEGCNPGNFRTMDKVVQTLKAAGMVVVASAGNSGSKCGSVNDPAAIFADVFSVGATRSNDSIASFSSRGPVAVDGSFRLKPDISAPGVSVRSALPDSSYARFSGTSMAGPHVAGAVALLISANPALAGQVDLIEQIIEETAVPLTDTVACGDLPSDAVPNYTYGYGRLNVYAAVQRALQLTDIDLPSSRSAVQAFPNPAGDEFYLRFSGLADAVQLDLFNAAGQRLLHRQLTATAGQHTEVVNMRSFPAGAYWYLLRDGQGRQVASGKLVRY